MQVIYLGRSSIRLADIFLIPKIPPNFIISSIFSTLLHFANFSLLHITLNGKIWQILFWGKITLS
jgi:hypothetical protein